jgi:predicted AAA+ superfamily ATPase
MLFKRNLYLDKLISKKDNGLIKVITGIRRCGKSILLFELYNEYLNSIGILDENIVKISLDDVSNIKYRNPFELDKFIREKVSKNGEKLYVFIDEVQLVVETQNPYILNAEDKIGFVPVLLGLMKLQNVDIYVTGSNSKMLSSDVLTEFKGRSDEIKVNPLTYKEFCDAYQGDKKDCWNQYFVYGGMPFLLSLTTHQEKSKYLKNLFSQTYISDVIERWKLRGNKEVLEDILNILSSNIGSLTNPSKLSNTFKSEKKLEISPSTISLYIDYFIDAFILNKANRYDVKGKKYIHTPIKYYFSDIGLRNALINFRQTEENHIMENIIYNELIVRGFDVDVGIVEYNYKDHLNRSQRTQFEIDFIANSGYQRYYIQSALSVANEEKRQQEINSLKRIPDSFKKIVVIKDDIIPWYDEYGILYIGIEKFLLDETILTN